MQNLIKKPFIILKNNLIFIQPLLFCLLILLTGLTFIFYKNLYSVPRILLLISMVLMLIAFSAGWFYINKYGILTYNENDSKEETNAKTIENFKKFFEGVGKDFLKTALAYVIVFLIYAGVVAGVSELCMLAYGEPKIIYDLPKLVQSNSQAELLSYLNTITANDKIVFGAWIMTINLVTSVMNFFVVLYFTVLSFEKMNVFKAVWQTIKFFFKNILASIVIMIFVSVLYVFLNILSILLGTNSLSFVVLIILFTMYLNYYLLLVFCLYYDKTKNNSDNRTEFIG